MREEAERLLYENRLNTDLARIVGPEAVLESLPAGTFRATLLRCRDDWMRAYRDLIDEALSGYIPGD